MYWGKFAFQNPHLARAYTWREIYVSKSIGLAYSWKEIFVSNLPKGVTETRLEDAYVDLSKTQPCKYFVCIDQENPALAKTEEWTTQTGINCDSSVSDCNHLAHVIVRWQIQRFIRYCTVFALFILCFRAISKYKIPRGDLTGLFALRVWRAYIWKGLISEFYGI